MSLRHNTRDLLVVFVIVGMVTRFILIPLTTMPYDMSFWAGVINGFNMGEGLYESEYFWYSPTWGYILAFLTPVMDALNINIQGIIAPGIGEDGLHYVYGAITDPAFNAVVKSPLLISDLLVALFLFYIVRHLTDDGRKSAYAFALWFLNPLVIWNSAVQGQFDTLAILGMVSSILFTLQGRYALSGACIVFGGITKLFPIVFVPLIIAYIVSKSPDMRTALRGITASVIAGALVAVMLFLPVMITGDVSESLRFLTDRFDSYSDGATADMFRPLWGNIITLAPVIAVLILALTYRLATSRDGQEGRFVLYGMLSVAFMFMWPIAPPYSQYALVLLPLLIAVNFNGYDLRFPILVLSLLFTASVAVLTGPEMFYPLSFCTDIISPDTIAHMETVLRPLLSLMYDRIEWAKFIPALVAVIIVVTRDRIKRRVAHGSHA